MSTSQRSPRGRHRLRNALIAVALVVAVALGAAAAIGPRFGFYLVPPSPQAYVDAALEKMDQAYFASGPNWAEARSKAKAATKNARSYRETYPALTEALAVAGGRHSHFYPAGQSLAKDIPERTLPTQSRAGQVTTVTLPPLTADDAQFEQHYADTVADAVKTQPACGYIVDLRQNEGGNMWPMLAGLAALVPDGTPLQFRTRAGQNTPVTVNGGSVLLGGKEQAKADVGGKLTVPVAVLTDDHTASSGEAVLLSLRGLPNVRTFGSGTAGYASANQIVNLYDGASMLVTGGVDVDRTGATFGDDPVPPDQATNPAEAPVTARSWLESRGC